LNYGIIEIFHCGRMKDPEKKSFQCTEEWWNKVWKYEYGSMKVGAEERLKNMYILSERWIPNYWSIEPRWFGNTAVENTENITKKWKY
jgi:hypothetical protein